MGREAISLDQNELRSTSAAGKVVIPELLRTILSHLASLEQTKLRTMSRSFFNHTAPLVWKESTRIEEIFGLIPGVIIADKREFGGGYESNLVLVGTSCRYFP